MVMLSSLWMEPGSKSGPMNGEDCGLSVPSPEQAWYLGKVSCALFLSINYAYILLNSQNVADIAINPNKCHLCKLDRTWCEYV